MRKSMRKAAAAAGIIAGECATKKTMECCPM